MFLYIYLYIVLSIYELWFTRWTTIALLVLLCCFAITGPSRRHGRGRAKGIKEWGTGAKLNVDWGSVPEDIVEGIWKEVQDNLLYAPEGLKQVVIDSCNKLWKDHKHKTKTNHYKPFKDDPNINEKVPLDILPEQWRVMVEYWSSKDAMKIASRNSKNRELRGPVHRTGRTPFADVRHKMMTDGESTNKMSVFMKTRMITDPDVKLFLDEYNEQLSMIDEPLRTEEVQDKIFHNLVGKDGHGYCKTYGIGVPRSAVYKKDVSPSQASSSSTVEEITQQVRQTVTEEIEQRLTVEIEQRVTEKLKTEFEQVRAWMDFIRSQGGLSGIQLPNASSGRQQVRKSVGDHDSQDDELLGSPVQSRMRGIRVEDRLEGLINLMDIISHVLKTDLNRDNLAFKNKFVSIFP
ncbi:hypothetical protein TEA_012393 [Camellia sinensis var. sinensis]|uniref:Transposase, Ptta/En/Spm, plant n=1 Tax=Camellia sinensis var. sinensis TaxID=542762 RepID=A0A4V3WKA7_CAMSN|nr:hypothetical protein TEA_012393 [Camellia sinensis var. sinensis]